MSDVSFHSLDTLSANPLVFDGGRIVVTAWRGGKKNIKSGQCTYGVLSGGKSRISFGRDSITLPSHSYFQSPGPASVEGGEGLLVEVAGWPQRPFRMGIVPDEAAIKYTPGGELFQLCHPDTFGEPSLNMLKMSPNLSDQDDHCHESLRVNIVISGSVECFTHSLPPRRILPGEVIIIPPRQFHRFVAGPVGMRFVAFHPDSKYGPTEGNNTLHNNTFFG